MTSGVESARLKVQRAAVHIETIQQYVFAYTAEQPDLITKEPDGTKKLRFTSQPPPGIAVLVGEVVYQLRSALDHLAFDLVKRNPNGAQLPADWEENCFFPLWLKVPKKPPVYNCFGHILPGITEGAFAFIEGLQPYHGGNGPAQLSWLAELSNIDKHRHLHIINPQAYQTEYIRSARFSSDGMVRVRDGAELQPSLHTDEQLAEAVQVESGVAHPFVSFDESALLPQTVDLPVDHILELCADTISTVIIPAFDKLIKNP